MPVFFVITGGFFIFPYLVFIFTGINRIINIAGYFGVASAVEL
jgi:hypothetical protein